MLALVFIVALLAYSSAVITDNNVATEAALPITSQQWDAITAGLEYSGEAAAGAVAAAKARQQDTGVVVRPLPPRGRNGQTVMLDPLPPNSIIGKGAGLILEKPPTGLTVTQRRR